MPIELKDKKTPLKPKEVFDGLYLAWKDIFNCIPKRESLLVLLSQSTLESGAGYKSCHNYNLGNIKSREGDNKDYCYFACNEILSINQANILVKKNPGLVKITSTLSNNMAVVWFYPKAEGCRFRAYSTLKEGCTDYLLLLKKRFDKSWEAVLEGDPSKFVKALKAQKYFTADLNKYLKAVLSIYSKYEKDNSFSIENLTESI
jgi:hypothetical protein